MSSTEEDPKNGFQARSQKSSLSRTKKWRHTTSSVILYYMVIYASVIQTEEG